ncbi:hypothetical protein PG994_013695 [Apiospora phragmitis]|uniref:Uncharacterized protein n=1 Tax=Apiospora phragmitis TaxID=2905665 RepID=A0ABR1T9E2_9PEZI
MPTHPIGSLIIIFRYFCAAESHYLDMVATVLEDVIPDSQIVPVARKRETIPDIRRIILHSNRMLRRRRAHITDILQYLDCHSAAFSEGTSGNIPSVKLLKTDLDHLLLSNADLMSRCQHDLDSMTSEATFEDAERGITLSKSSRKFTAFAAIYVPLAFTSSVFGMNFIQINDISWGFKLWVLVTIPSPLVSTMRAMLKKTSFLEMETKNRNVVASLNFIKRLDLYESEKPFSIAHDIEGWTGNVPRSNYSKERVATPIEDIRGREDSFTFEKNGFAVIETTSSLDYNDFEDKKKVQDTYVPEVGSCLLEYFNATSVHVFSVLLTSKMRRRHPKFPQVEVRKTGDIIQPATRVHVDGTSQAIGTLLAELDETRPHANKRFIYVNVWKPLKGPLYDWPLALCDAATVEDQDLETHDQVLPQVVRENYMVRHNAKHRWCPPHFVPAAPRPGSEHIPRESIELRAIVYLD